MVRNTGKIHIRLELEGDIAEQFETIKKKRGLKNSTEVVRAIIRDAYNELGVPA